MLTFKWDLILFTILLVLKLAEVIDWSWWWVTAPLWLTFLVLMCFKKG